MPHLRNPPKYPQVVIPSAARNLLFPLPPRPFQLQPAPHNHPLPTPRPLPPSVILSVAKDPPSIPPLRLPTRPIPFHQPNNPPPTASPTPKPVPPLDSRALHFDHNYRLLIDGKPF